MRRNEKPELSSSLVLHVISVKCSFLNRFLSSSRRSEAYRLLKYTLNIRIRDNQALIFGGIVMYGCETRYFRQRVKVKGTEDNSHVRM